MNIPLKEIHIGQAIEKRVKELGFSKSEFARRLGIHQQHINRIFERNTIETRKLVEICKVLDYNFFALFCEINNDISAVWSAIDPFDSKDDSSSLSSENVVTQLMLLKIRYKGVSNRFRIVEDMCEQMKSQMEDKNEIIKVKGEIIDELKVEIAKLRKELTKK